MEKTDFFNRVNKPARSAISECCTLASHLLVDPSNVIESRHPGEATSAKLTLGKAWSDFCLNSSESRRLDRSLSQTPNAL